MALDDSKMLFTRSTRRLKGPCIYFNHYNSYMVLSQGLFSLNTSSRKEKLQPEVSESDLRNGIAQSHLNISF